MYRGFCAGCGAACNSKAFKSRRQGRNIPAHVDVDNLPFRNLDEPHSSNLCNACYLMLAPSGVASSDDPLEASQSDYFADGPVPRPRNRALLFDARNFGLRSTTGPILSAVHRSEGARLKAIELAPTQGSAVVSTERSALVALLLEVPCRVQGCQGHMDMVNIREHGEQGKYQTSVHSLRRGYRYDVPHSIHLRP